ncbi:MAG: hypothetical protein KGL59_13185 [Acidobacteriota bacterium]|nr:hypothetical protein [Acidobacteriota bacterium]
MTPLYITTAGLDISQSVSVQFSNSSGFSLTEQPTRVASDGTVVVAVPLYVDPSSGQIGSGAVSLVLTQGSQTSAPVTITIQDLPAVSSYGTQLGQISHVFLNYEAMRIARRIGELQAFQELPGNTVDTTQAQASLQTLLLSVIEARNDVDRVALDNTLVISGGTLPDGTPIQFDKNSLDMMDRTFGLYLSELASVYSPPAVAARQGIQEKTRTARTPSAVRPSAASGAGPLVSAATFDSILNYIGAANSLTGLTQSYSDSLAKDPTFLDKLLTVANAEGALYGLATLGGSTAQTVVGAAYGSLVSGVAVMNDAGMELGDLSYIIYASHYGGDPAVLQEAQADINNRSHDALINTIQAELNLATVGGYFGSFGSGVIGSFLNIENAGGQVAIQSASLMTSVYGCVTSPDGPCYGAIEQTALNLAGEVTQVFSSATQGFAEVTGTATISNSQGSTLAADTGVEIGSFDVTGSEVTALGDPGGNYDFFIPLGAPNTDYTNLTLTAFDPVSDIILSSTTVNLSGLTTTTPTILPSLQGTCSDADASGPDADDPDCD